jgi:hypothetical protein
MWSSLTIGLRESEYQINPIHIYLSIYLSIQVLGLTANVRELVGEHQASIACCLPPSWPLASLSRFEILGLSRARRS